MWAASWAKQYAVARMDRRISRKNLRESGSLVPYSQKLMDARSNRTCSTPILLAATHHSPTSAITLSNIFPPSGAFVAPLLSGSKLSGKTVLAPAIRWGIPNPSGSHRRKTDVWGNDSVPSLLDRQSTRLEDFSSPRLCKKRGNVCRVCPAHFAGTILDSSSRFYSFSMYNGSDFFGAVS